MTRNVLKMKFQSVSHFLKAKFQRVSHFRILSGVWDIKFPLMSHCIREICVEYCHLATSTSSRGVVWMSKHWWCASKPNYDRYAGLDMRKFQAGRCGKVWGKSTTCALLYCTEAVSLRWSSQTAYSTRTGSCSIAKIEGNHKGDTKLQATSCSIV